MSAPPSQMESLRTGAALSRQEETRVVRVGGEHAWDLLDREVTCDLYLRDGQARPGLLLHRDGRVAADLTVLCADETFWLLLSGEGAASAVDRLGDAAHAGEAVEVIDLTGDLAVIGLDGPFAWEALAAHAGRGVIGLPLLSFFTMDGGTLCLRDGRLGEYGYRFVASAAHATALEDALRDAGDRVRLPLGAASLLTRQAAMLENHVFCADLEGRSDLDAGELQLGWRLSADKAGPGMAAIRERHTAGTARRTVTFRTARHTTDRGIALDGAPVGQVLRLEPCLHGPGFVGLGAVPERMAHPGISSLHVGGVPMLTVSPPLVANRSLYVNAQHHRYAARDEIRFPADAATSRAPRE